MSLALFQNSSLPAGSIAWGTRSGGHFKSPPDIGLVEMAPAPRSSAGKGKARVDFASLSVGRAEARTGVYLLAASLFNPRHRLEAGIGHHFYQADIGRRLKMMGDTRQSPRMTDSKA